MKDDLFTQEINATIYKVILGLASPLVPERAAKTFPLLFP